MPYLVVEQIGIQTVTVQGEIFKQVSLCLKIYEGMEIWIGGDDLAMTPIMVDNVLTTTVMNLNTGTS